MWILMAHKRGTDIRFSLIPDIRHITGYIVISKPNPHPNIKISMTTRWFHLTFSCLRYSFIPHWVQDTCAPQSAVCSFNYPPSHPPISVCLLSKNTLPLLPAPVIPTSKHDKKAKDGEEDDSVSRHHQSTGTPLDCAITGQNNGESKWGYHDASC